MRPSLTRGLPFRLLPRPTMTARAGEVKRKARSSSRPTRLQPRRYFVGKLLRAAQATWRIRPAFAVVRPALTAATECVDWNTGCARMMSLTHSWHRRPKRCPVFRILRSRPRTTPTMPDHPQRWQTPCRRPRSSWMPSERYRMLATPLVVQFLLPCSAAIKHGGPGPR